MSEDIVYDYAYGIIPLRRTEEGDWSFLIVQHVHGGHWGFPKGHAEGAESPFDAALRELDEEVGLEPIHVFDLPPIQCSYQFTGWSGDTIAKTVAYFIVEVNETDVAFDPAEIMAVRWVRLEELDELLPETKGSAELLQGLRAHLAELTTLEQEL